MKKLLQNKDFRISLFTALGFQAGLTIIGVIIALISHTDPLQHNFNWDSWWYKSITESFYTDLTEPYIHNAVFYPLFPLCLLILKTITFNVVPLSVLGLLLNTVCLIFALYFLRQICHELSPKNRKLPLIVTILFLTFHSSFFLHCVYSEALLLMLGLGAYYFALKRNWKIMAIFLAFTTAVRLPGLLFVGLCGLEFMRAYDFSLKKIFNKNLWWFLLAPLGIVAYMIYLWIVRGDPLAMFHAYSDSVWTYQIFNLNIFAVYITYIQNFFSSPIKAAIIDYALPLYSIFMVFVTSLYALIKRRQELFPLAIFGLASIVMFSLNSNLISVNRYVLTAISQFIILGIFATESKKKWPLLLVSAIILVNIIICAVAYYGFINTEFVG